jgi:hypothetical protein
MQGGGPAMSRRNLGHALRALREAAQITGENAGAAVDRSSSWISRVESGRVGLRRRELLTLLDLYGLRDSARVTELAELAETGRQRAWWSQYSYAFPAIFVRYLGVEAEAHAIKIFQDKVIPGLLQTERYMRAVFERLTPPLSPAAVEQNVRVRLQRQRLVADEVAGLDVIIDESVLRRVMGDPELMREQLGSLLETMAGSRADIRILPLSGQEHAIPNGTFTVLEFADSPSIVYIDTAGGGVFEEGHSVTSIYQTIFSDLQRSALSVEETTRYLRNLIGDLR